jgi:hypothetical protein
METFYKYVGLRKTIIKRLQNLIAAPKHKEKWLHSVQKSSPFYDGLLGFCVKNVQMNYTKNGTVLPGYTPGWFLRLVQTIVGIHFGSQDDVRFEVAKWMVNKYPDFNQISG